MKVFCALLVLVALLGFAQSGKIASPRQRMNQRTPFYLRQRASSSSESFIVGGVPADIADFPHHLAMLLNGRYICGASIISRRFSLSAAHCLDFGAPANTISLWGGSTSRLTGGHIFPVRRYVLHPQYDDWTLDFDVAIMEVDRMLEGFPNMRPIALPASCTAACCGVCEPTAIRVAGWGAIESGRLPVNLLQVSKTIVNTAACSAAWREPISSRMFCTLVENGRDSCQGDSGGVLLENGILVGIISYGSTQCGGGDPSVYTRLENIEIRDWIKNNTGI
ncbi:unnamed protein product [Diamesa tonsa]